jgi:hypothetical protein
MTEAGMASNRSQLGRKWSVLEQLSDALLIIRLDVYSDSQEKGMIFAAIPTVNRNIICWHRACPRLCEHSLVAARRLDVSDPGSLDNREKANRDYIAGNLSLSSVIGSK